MGDAVRDAESSGLHGQRPRPSGGNWGLLLLLLGVVGFVVWGIWLVRRPQTAPDVPAPASGDAGRAVELIQGAADTYRDDPDARSECLGALRVLPRDARTTGIIHCLGSPGPEALELKNAAACYAAEFVAGDSRLVGPLTAALEDNAELAAFALSRSPDARAFAALSEEAHSKRAKETTWYAIWALAGREEPEATEALLDVLATGPDDANGQAAARALGYRADPSAYRPLANLLKTIQPTEERCTSGERAALALAGLGQDAALKHLREAAHRIGDHYTSERLTLAFALCRLRPPDDYNFWVLAEGVKAALPYAPYRKQVRDEFEIAMRLIVQLDDERVKPALIAASERSDGHHAECLLRAFGRLGLEPVWDQERRGYVLRALPPDQAPKHPPYVLMPPWPFSEATGQSDGGGTADPDSRS